jgi:hypothetical protein
VRVRALVERVVWRVVREEFMRGMEATRVRTVRFGGEGAVWVSVAIVVVVVVVGIDVVAVVVVVVVVKRSESCV